MMQTDTTNRPWLAFLVGVLVIYGLAAAFGWPQRATKLIAEGHAATPRAEADDAAAKVGAGHGSGETSEHGESHATIPPPYWTMVPFVLLLGAIAVLPLTPGASHWWESNLHRFYVAGSLALATLLYYLVLHGHLIHAHWPVSHVANPTEAGLNTALTWEVFANAILGEYIPFIVLLFSLYTISGGVRIEGDLPAHPGTNAMFLAAGGLLASFIGTTGAAMILIRPLLETNRERKHVKHTVVFFIFVACNCGGCLLPLGDPPLFLGYLKGVPFLWTWGLWKAWAFVNGALILGYWAWDQWFFYPRETKFDIQRDEAVVRRLQFRGLWPNGLLLVGVILSVGLLDPSKPMPGLDWRPWLYLREAVQLALVACSLFLGSRSVRTANRFNYTAIVEVAVLFFGIFICMQPPLQMLAVAGPRLGLTTPGHFFWATGGLSAVLDNAPTYVVFFETARSLTEAAGWQPAVAGVSEGLLAAISLGAVFMGACTYIGNGPNFMVKSIAEESGVPMPSFFGFMAYSVVFLGPLFLLTAFLFL